SRKTPAGVDRVDASFAAHFLSADIATRKALLFTPLGPRAVRSAAARRIFEGVQDHWREKQCPDADSAFLHVRDALAGASQITARRSLARRVGEALSAGAKAAPLYADAWRQISAIGTDAVYLNVSQYPLSTPSYFHWLRERPDIKPVFMIHDLL